MKQIKVRKWQARQPKGELITESTLTLLNALIIMVPADEMPRGVDHFRTFGRLAAAFDKAEESGVLELEDGDFELVRRTMASRLPAVWAMNKEIAAAVNDLLNVK